MRFNANGDLFNFENVSYRLKEEVFLKPFGRPGKIIGISIHAFGEAQFTVRYRSVNNDKLIHQNLFLDDIEKLQSIKSKRANDN